jgi:hypothetical protein
VDVRGGRSVSPEPTDQETVKYQAKTTHATIDSTLSGHSVVRVTTGGPIAVAIPITEIVDSFEERKCVLLLGPNLPIGKGGELFEPPLIDYFKAKQLDIEQDLDNLFICKKQTKTRACLYLKEYFRNNGVPNDLHRRLARIPCHLYISISPDLFMKQALEDYGVEHEFKYYIKGQPAEEVANPGPDNPLLYNLFGSIDNQQSLIFTHDDLIQYMLSIIKDFNLPQNLRGNLVNSLYFVFLGFDFDKWYLRLLLKLFLDESKLSIALEAGSRTQDELRTFYAGNYGLEFVDSNIEVYIKGLYDECDQRGLLRPIKEKIQSSIQDEISELIRKDEVSDALEQLYQFLENLDEQTFNVKGEEKHEQLNEVDNHIAKLNRTEKSLRKQVISEENARIEKNRIIEAVQAIAQTFAV